MYVCAFLYPCLFLDAAPVTIVISPLVIIISLYQSISQTVLLNFRWRTFTLAFGKGALYVHWINPLGGLERSSIAPNTWPYKKEVMRKGTQYVWALYTCRLACWSLFFLSGRLIENLRWKCGLYKTAKQFFCTTCEATCYT